MSLARSEAPVRQMPVTEGEDKPLKYPTIFTMRTLGTSAKTGEGMPEYIAFLEGRLAEMRASAV